MRAKRFIIIAIVIVALVILFKTTDGTLESYNQLSIGLREKEVADLFDLGDFERYEVDPFIVYLSEPTSKIRFQKLPRGLKVDSPDDIPKVYSSILLVFQHDKLVAYNWIGESYGVAMIDNDRELAPLSTLFVWMNEHVNSLSNTNEASATSTNNPPNP